MNDTKILPTIFRDFKRHYHKVTKVYEKLTNSGSFTLKINIEESSGYAETKTPDEEETVRFVVLMHRFLSPSDAIYYRKVWAFLKEQFADVISADRIEAIEALTEKLNKGYLGIKIDNEDLTAEKIYRTLSNSGYFDYNEEAQKYLQSLAQAPLVGPLLWFQFYAYTLLGLTLVSLLLEIIIHVETSAKYRAFEDETRIAKNLCIYCLTDNGNFNSEEHIFPEALGNNKLILPKGYVCDKCNNGILSQLDNALINFEPIAFLRVQFVPYTKQGKLPEANFQNVLIKRTSPRNIAIKAKDKTGRMKNKKHLGDDWYSFTLEMKGKKLNPKLIARALYKIALGMVALAQGHEQASSKKFDAARDFILNGERFENNLLMRSTGKPHPQVRTVYRDLPKGTVFVIDIYGLIFLLNLESVPVLELNEEPDQANFTLYSLLAS